MKDPELDVIRREYDVLAEDYARNIYGELQHKPLDRELLTRFAKSVRGEICDLGCGPGHGGTSLAWKLLIGAAYIFFGGYLLFHPIIGVASLTLLLAILFLVEGVLDLILWWKMRSLQGSFWILLDGILTLILGGMIYVHWPSSAVWALGTLLGVGFIMHCASIGMVPSQRVTRRNGRVIGELDLRIHRRNCER